MSKLGSLLILFLLYFLPSCSKEEDSDLSWNEPGIISFECIWNKSPHCAFTDLIKFNSKYYCTFREAYEHIPSSSKSYGKITILESYNGIEWYPASYIVDKGYDLRDPKFSITPDNKLMVVYGCSVLNDQNKLIFQKTMNSFASMSLLDSNQLSISASNNIKISNSDNVFSQYWLWKVVWHNGIAYGVAYSSPKNPILVSSKDGINFEVIAELVNNTNEADIHFSTNNYMTIIIRSNGSNGYIGKAKYPYNKWDWHTLNQRIESPKIIEIKDKIFVTGRGNSGGNVLYHLKENNNLELIYTFPGRGDSAYPGAIVVKDQLWVSYYTTNHKHSSIYLVKISIENILNKIN